MKFEPVKMPPDATAGTGAIIAWRQDIARRLCAVFERYGLPAMAIDDREAPLSEGEARWRRLVVRMAIRNGEPELTLPPLAKLPGDREINNRRRDAMMNWLINYEIDDRGVLVERDFEKRLSELDAAKLTTKQLDKEARTWRNNYKPITAETLRSQYNKRNHDRKNTPRDDDFRPDNDLVHREAIGMYLERRFLIEQIESIARDMN